VCSTALLCVLSGTIWHDAVAASNSETAGTCDHSSSSHLLNVHSVQGLSLLHQCNQLSSALYIIQLSMYQMYASTLIRGGCTDY
jgi:hypothetical protein